MRIEVMTMLRRTCLCIALLLMSHIAVDPVLTHPSDRPSPAYSFTLADDQKVELGTYRGKVVILAFVNTECPHCQRVSRMLSTIQTSYGAEKLQVFAIAVNDDAKQRVSAFKEAVHPTFPVGMDTEASVQSYLAIPPTGLIYTPVVVVIDRAGVIRAEHGGHNRMVDDEQALRGLVDQLLTVSTHD